MAFTRHTEMGCKVGPRLRESRLLTPSGPEARVHATKISSNSPALYIVDEDGKYPLQTDIRDRRFLF